jgi:hypothetical protein
MSDDFGTVNVRRGDRTREIDILRQRYHRHRENLMNLASDAPSEHLSAEYQRLIREIDTALGKLGELEGRKPSDTQPMKSEPGTRPLVTPPGMIISDVSEPSGPGAAFPRIALIIGAGVIVLGIIVWLMWGASGEKPVARSINTETTPVTESLPPQPVTPAPKPVVASLSIEPASQDYGTIRKGTRAVRQFQVTNNGDTPFKLEVARSACRCLYYDYNSTLAPHKKETVTVTVDGAKAKRGTLHEKLALSSKSDASVTGSLDVTATIK